MLEMLNFGPVVLQRLGLVDFSHWLWPIHTMLFEDASKTHWISTHDNFVPDYFSQQCRQIEHYFLFRSSINATGANTDFVCIAFANARLHILAWTNLQQILIFAWMFYWNTEPLINHSYSLASRGSYHIVSLHFACSMFAYSEFSFSFNIMSRLKLFESPRSWLWILRYFFVWPFHVDIQLCWVTLLNSIRLILLFVTFFDAIDTKQQHELNWFSFVNRSVSTASAFISNKLFSNFANWNLRTHNALSRWYSKKSNFKVLLIYNIPATGIFFLRIGFFSPGLEPWMWNCPY